MPWTGAFEGYSSFKFHSSLFKIQESFHNYNMGLDTYINKFLSKLFRSRNYTVNNIIINDLEYNLT